MGAIKNAGKAGFSLIVIILLMTLTAGADFKIKSVSETDAFEVMGQQSPATNDTVTAWIGDVMSKATVKGSMSIVSNNVDGSVMMIDNNAKSYIKTNMSELSAMVEQMPRLAKLFDDSALANDETGMAMQLKQMFEGLMNITVDIKPVDEFMDVNGWKSQKHNIEMNLGFYKGQMTAWVTKETKIDPDMFTKIYFADFADKPVFKQISDSFKGLDGIIVKSETVMDIFGAKVTNRTEVLEVVEQAAPKGLYSVPEGYVETPSPFTNVNEQFNKFLDSMETAQGK